MLNLCYQAISLLPTRLQQGLFCQHDYDTLAQYASSANTAVTTHGGIADAGLDSDQTLIYNDSAYIQSNCIVMGRVGD